MKKLIISLLLILLVFVSAGPAAAEIVAKTDTLTQYDRNTLRYQNFFHRLIPNQFTLQYAGSIGVISYGIGWHYGKHKNWETELLVGHVPKYNSSNAKATFTAKQRYIPWHVDLGSRWQLQPLTTGLTFNSIFGEDFWANQPSRYPKKYYGFSTKVRFNVFVGSRMYYNIAHSDRHYLRGIGFYYELGTSELYAISALPNKNVRIGDILSLALGVTLDIF